MKLLDLSPEERAFLTGEPVIGRRRTDWVEGVGQQIAALLRARLRLAVQLTTLHAEPSAEAATMTPVWQIDAALAACWVTRRLGGHSVSGSAPFVPQALRALLDQALAEAWLGAQPPVVLGAQLVWRVQLAGSEARLGVQVPAQSGDFMQWAQGVMRHE